MHTFFHRPWASWSAALLLLVAAATARAEVVTLNHSSTTTARHEYFLTDPVVSAEAQVVGSSGSWALQRGVSQGLNIADLRLGTGPAVETCCYAEVHDFVFGLTVGGITQQITAAVKATEIANDQYQFDVLDRPGVVFDLGSLGLLTVDVRSFALQMRANIPLYHVTYVFADVLLSERPQAVPLPATLALAALGLVLLSVQRQRQAARQR